MQNKICIWDSDTTPDKLTDFSFVFWSKSHKIDQESFSILEILESNSDQLKSQYLNLIYDLGKSNIYDETVIDLLKIKDDLSFWWMTLIVEKSNWAKSPHISNVIKMMALNLFICQNKYNKIYIKTNNQKLADSVQLLCESLGIEIEIYSNDTTILSPLFCGNYLLNTFFVLKGMLWLLRESILSIFFKILNKNSWISSSPKLIFVSYLSTVDLKNVKNNNFNNTFWGTLPNYLIKKQVSTNWLYLPSKRFTVYQTLRALLKLKSQKNTSQEHMMVSSFFNIYVLLKTLKYMFVIFNSFSKVKRELRSASKFLWPLMENDVSRSLLSSNMVSSLFYLSLFESLEYISNKKAKVVYLHENQPWELGLISSFKSEKRTITGFAHSTIRYWDLRYFDDKKSYEGCGIHVKPTPNNLALHGVNDASMMMKFGYPEYKIKKVESLRYLYLKNLNTCSTEPTNRKQTLLILGDYLRSNTLFMLSLLKSIGMLNLLRNFNVIIKPHPACPIELDDLDSIDHKVQNTDLGNLILSANIVFTGNVSSAAVEAYSMGKLVISARNLEDLDMSPLRGAKDVKFVSDSVSLEGVLRKALRNAKNQKNLELFNLNSDLTLWKKVLDV